jgi:hypothetical protein
MKAILRVRLSDAALRRRPPRAGVYASTRWRLNSLVDGDEEESFERAAVGFGISFDFPVDGRSRGECGCGLRFRQSEFNGDFVPRASAKFYAAQGFRIAAEFEADDLGFAIVAAAARDVSLPDAAKRERNFLEIGKMVWHSQARAQRAAEVKREIVVGEESVAIAEQFDKHL